MSKEVRTLVATRTMQEFRMFRQPRWKLPTSVKEKLQQPCTTVNGLWRHQPRCLHIRAQHLLSFVWRERELVRTVSFISSPGSSTLLSYIPALAQTWQWNFIQNDDASSISQWRPKLAGGLNKKKKFRKKKENFWGGYQIGESFISTTY